MRVMLMLMFCLVGGMVFAQTAELKEGFYPDGKLRYKGLFTDGKPQGEVIHYFPDGKIKAVMNHQGNEVDARIYSKNGEFTTSGKYLDRKKTGKWVYKKGEQWLAEEEYKDNKFHGTSIKFYSTGGVSEEKNWKEGRLSGVWKMFYEGGAVRFEVCFVDGKLEGPVKSYNYNGILTVDGAYKNNLKEGVWSYYDAAGQLKKERTYIAGVPENREQEEIEETLELDKLLEQSVKIADPADFTDEPELYLRIIGK